MPEYAVSVSGIGKVYKIGAKHLRARHDTLRDRVAAGIKASKNLLTGRKSVIFGSEEFWALKDITFNVSKGEVLGIIGVNGAGKSTLLKILCRVTSPTTGRAVMRGKVGTLLEVGTGFNHELTGRENIYLSGAILGMKKSYIDAKFDEIVSFSGVEKFIDTPVKRYSSGMVVRLGFAVAAHLQPDILLIDEVLAVGDAKFRKKCLGKMHDVAKEGRTVVFVSHNMRAVTSLCDRALRLNAGRIVDQGNPTDVVDRYLTSGDIAQNSAEWRLDEAPGNEFLTLRKISAINIDNPEVAIGMENSFKVSISYVNHIAGSSLAISLHLFNEQGDLILNPSNGNDNLTTEGLSTAEYTTEFFFPGGLLNSGKYLITLLFVEKGGVQRLWIKDVLVFQVKEKRVKEIDAWYGRNPGLIAMEIPTETFETQKRNASL